MSGKFDYKPEFLYLTTTGRKSGLPREIEIWFVERDGCYYLCAEHRERADWVQNIQQNPAIHVHVEGKTFSGRGRALDSATDSPLIAQLAALYDEKYEWSDGLFVELCPINE